MIRHILLTLKYCSIVTNIVSSELPSLPIPLGRSVRPPYVIDPNPEVHDPIYDDSCWEELKDCFEAVFICMFLGVTISYYGTLWCIIVVGYLVAFLFHLVSCGYLFRFVEFHYCSCCSWYEFAADLGGADGTGYPNGMLGFGGLCCLLCICGDGVVLREGEVRGGGGHGGDGGGGGGDGGGGCGGGGDGGGGC